MTSARACRSAPQLKDEIRTLARFWKLFDSNARGAILRSDILTGADDGPAVSASSPGGSFTSERRKRRRAVELLPPSPFVASAPKVRVGIHMRRSSPPDTPSNSGLRKETAAEQPPHPEPQALQHGERFPSFAPAKSACSSLEPQDQTRGHTARVLRIPDRFPSHAKSSLSRANTVLSFSHVDALLGTPANHVPVCVALARRSRRDTRRAPTRCRSLPRHWAPSGRHRPCGPSDFLARRFAPPFIQPVVTGMRCWSRFRSVLTSLPW